MIRRAILALGLFGAGAGSYAGLATVDLTESRCDPGWTETRGSVPEVGDSLRAGQSFLVCENPDDRRIVTAWEDGTVEGQNADGTAVVDPAQYLR